MTTEHDVCLQKNACNPDSVDSIHGDYVHAKKRRFVEQIRAMLLSTNARYLSWRRYDRSLRRQCDLERYLFE